MSDNKFNRISDALNTAAEVSQVAQDAGLVKTGKATGWLGLFGAIASLFGSKRGTK